MSQLPVCIPHCFIFSLGIIQRLPDKRAMKLGQWLIFWLRDETQIERSPFLLLDRASNGFMLLISRENEITKNNFKRIGISGWTSDTPNGPGAIWIDGSSINNEIFEMKFPPGKSHICNMILDLTDDSGIGFSTSLTTVEITISCNN